MQVDKEVDLYRFSTMRTHSIASVMYTPNNIDELKKIVNICNKHCYFLGGGSNVVFSSRVGTPIINLMELNKKLELNDDNSITSGCSIRIQELINLGKKNALGGFEYLYSLPASVGGIVYMNAGRGRVYNQQISDWLESVEYLDLNDMLIKTMKVNKAQWAFRHSPFQEMQAVILSATFRMQKLTVEIVTARIQERLETVKKTQDGNKPSCGSVFDNQNRIFAKLLRGKRIGGAAYSTRNGNWIINDQNGSGDDVIALIKYAQRIYHLVFKKLICEIRIFK